MLVALGLDDLGAGAHRDVLDLLELLDQVVGHRRLQRRPPHQQRHGLGVPGEEHRGLARRVRAADDVDVAALAGRRLGGRGAVEDAAAGQLGDAGGGQRAVRHARREHDAVGGDLRAVAELHDAGRAARLQADDVAGGEHLGAELRGLAAGPVGELGAGHAVGEAEVVLDPRALPGLPAGRLALDEHGAQALRRPVDGAAQPGRAAADDDEVVEVGWPGWW